MLKNISAVLTIVFVFLLCCPAFATARRLLKGIDFKTSSPNQEQVVFRLNSPVAPKFFTIKGENPRIVFDFKNTGAARGIKNTITTNGKFIEQIRVGIHETKVRVVLDLAVNKKIKVQRDFDENKNSLTVTVHDAAVKPEKKKLKQNKKGKKKEQPKTVSTARVKKKSEKKQRKKKQADQQSSAPKIIKAAKVKVADKESEQSTAGTLLSSVNFEHSNRGEMIQFRLNGFHPPVVYGLEEKKPKVICEFQDTAVDSRLPEHIKADGKFVRSIRITKEKKEKRVRVVLELTPSYSYDLQQVFFKNDNLFVIIINTLN